jgi:hypothetical protein
MRARLFAVAAAMATAGKAAFAQAPQPSTDWAAPTAIFIAIIAIVLVALAIGVWRLAANVAKCCARESDKTIRGYLFPLAPELYKEGGGGAFVLTRLGNFGRTPCILKESYLKNVAVEPSGNQAVYQAGQLFTHDLVFDVNAVDMRLNASALPIVGTASSYLIGYFRYLDVFGASHTTRYCYLVQPATALFERAGSAAWNEFD